MLFPARPQSLISRIVRRRAERIHAGERLVENQQLRLVDDRLRELHALAHALAVGADLLVRRVEQIDAGQRPPRRFHRVFLVVAVQADQRRHPFEAGHALVERILLGTEANLEIQRGIAPDRFAEHLHGALARFELTGDQLHERRLAGAVRTEQPGDARRHVHGDIVQSDHLPVPLRDLLGAHHGGPAGVRRGRIRRGSGRGIDDG